MRVKSISIKNFRSFKDVSVNLDSYSSLVGANGAGKSTVLCALNIFFQEDEESSTDVTKLHEEDFHERNTDHPIEITVTFCDLSDEAQEEFKDYFRQGVLTVMAKATYYPQTGVAEVVQYGQRLGIEAFRAFFEMQKDSSKKVLDLKEKYSEIRENYTDLPAAGSRQNMIDALHEYEAAHPEKCELIPSEDTFYGIGGKGKLAKFVQWIYLPAVKDAKEESIENKKTALGKILDRTVRSKINFEEDLENLKEDVLKKYRELLNDQKDSLNEISKSLTERLAMWSHPDAKAILSWNEDSAKSVQVNSPEIQLRAGERDFQGNLSRFGHGLQRSYLLAVLQELASSDDQDAPTLLFGCEEPELYQHPPQARHLASVLVELSEQNSQVIVSTHSPYFVCGRHFESMRMVRYDRTIKQSCIFESSYQHVSDKIREFLGDKDQALDARKAKLEQFLQPSLSEMFFASKIVFVEGLEDEAYIKALFDLSGKMEEYRRHQIHIVAVGGKQRLIEALVIAKMLDIPFYVVFDADRKENSKGSEDDQMLNSAILSLADGDPDDPFPEDIVWKDKFVQWPENIGKTFEGEIGKEAWNRSFNNVDIGLSNDRSKGKNPIQVGKHVEKMFNDGNIPTSLTKLIDEIIRFASTR